MLKKFGTEYIELTEASSDPAHREIRFRHPQLPPFLDTVEIRELQVNGAKVDLLLQRYPNNVG
jgi:hypothetical protein